MLLGRVSKVGVKDSLLARAALGLKFQAPGGGLKV